MGAVVRVFILVLLLPSCTKNWDQFPFPGVCRWEDPAAFTLSEPRSLKVRSDRGDLEPFLSADRLTLYFASTRFDGLMRGYRATRASLAEDFPDRVDPIDIDAPGLSSFAVIRDGLTAFIAAGVGYPASTSYEPSDLYWATRSAGSAFTKAQLKPISELSTAGYNEWDPFPTPDGLRLYYTEHDAKLGLTHLMTAWRQRPGDPWQKGFVPGLDPNTSPLKGVKADNPAVTEDELLIVFSSALGGGSPDGAARCGDSGSAGNRDLWYAVRAARDQPFGTPRPIPVVNTACFESEAYISPDGCELYFSRAEAGADPHIYSSRYMAR